LRLVWYGLVADVEVLVEYNSRRNRDSDDEMFSLEDDSTTGVLQSGNMSYDKK
jgi:hypothetical protein